MGFYNIIYCVHPIAYKIGSSLLKVSQQWGIISLQSSLLISKSTDVDVNLRNSATGLISLTLSSFTGTLSLLTAERENQAM